MQASACSAIYLFSTQKKIEEEQTRDADLANQRKGEGHPVALQEGVLAASLHMRQRKTSN